MRNDDEHSIGERNYEQFADRYAELAPTKPHNAYYDRPAVMELLGDVRDARVLDAGCGPGIYAAELVQRGAAVTAFDVTPAFVQIAGARLGESATVFRWNLEDPLDFAADGTFDAIVCALVLDYIEDWTPVMREFGRVLRPGGALVFSCGHPWADWQHAQEGGVASDSYFDRQLYTLPWRGFGKPYPEVTTWRHSLDEILGAVTDAGLLIERLVEPRPTEDFRRADPERYERLMREPVFLCVRAIRPGQGAPMAGPWNRRGGAADAPRR